MNALPRPAKHTPNGLQTRLGAHRRIDSQASMMVESLRGAVQADLAGQAQRRQVPLRHVLGIVMLLAAMLTALGGYLI